MYKKTKKVKNSKRRLKSVSHEAHKMKYMNLSNLNFLIPLTVGNVLNLSTKGPIKDHQSINLTSPSYQPPDMNTNFII